MLSLRTLLVCSLGLCIFYTYTVASQSVPSSTPSSSPSSNDDTSVFGWWEVLKSGHGTELLQYKWWLQYIQDEIKKEPKHAIIEVGAFAIIAFLLLRKPYSPQQKLSKQEENAVISEWEPEPLCPTNELVEYQKNRPVKTLESATGTHIVMNGGLEKLNFASANFLGFAGRSEFQQACMETIDKYGVGSCGPRGFYGSFDVHLEVEKRVAEFLGAEECILYSDSIACVSSVIPAFAKRGDLIICDAGAHYGIQQGCLLSRSSVIYFKHNDLADLERVLNLVAKEDEHNANKGMVEGVRIHNGENTKNRRFIIVEGISQYYGDICPLPEIMRLKQLYKYRLMLDDSVAIGTLGKTGKGSIEHWNIPISDVDVLCAGMDMSLSTVGGFCVGSHQVVDHQRLSGAGYCFSASSPPYTSTAGIVSVDLLQKEGLQVTEKVRANAEFFRNKLGHPRGVRVEGSSLSPVVHIRLSQASTIYQDELPSDLSSTSSVALKAKQKDHLRDQAFVDTVSDKLFTEDDILVDVPLYIPAERNPPAPSLRILITAAHTKDELDKLATALKKHIKHALDARNQQ